MGEMHVQHSRKTAWFDGNTEVALLMEEKGIGGGGHLVMHSPSDYWRSSCCLARTTARCEAITLIPHQMVREPPTGCSCWPLKSMKAMR